MITISVNTREAAVVDTELITTGSVGIQVHFDFSEEWELLTRVAVFRAGDNPDWYDITLGPENTCVIPWELLTEDNEGEPLFIGAFGEAMTDSVIAIPTIWVSAGAIKPGARSGNAGSADPTPTQWSQIRMLADSAAASAESAQESAETAETYAEHVPIVVDGYWAMWNGTDYVPTSQRAQGETGDPGQDGNDGFSPVVDVNEIAGGHSVTVTDAEGSETFNVMDGADGSPGRGVPEGGSTSQLLAKKSADDYDGEWVDPTAELLSYDDTETYSSGTVGAEIGGLKTALNSVSSHVEKSFNPNNADNVSLATLKTNLLSLASEMASNGYKSRLISFTCTDSPFTANLPFIGYFTVYNANYFEAIVSSYTGYVISIGCTNGGASWNIASINQRCIGGVSSVTTDTANTLLTKRIDLPAIYSGKTGSEYAAVITPTVESSAQRWFVLKNTGYFIVYERFATEQAAGTSQTFNYVVIVN